MNQNIDQEEVKRALRTVLLAIGENPDREGLQATPDRILRMFSEIFRGYDLAQKPAITTFENETGSENLIFDTGDFYSTCEHHMLPFFGRYFFAYVPKSDGKILGISKVSRAVNYCAARLQIQERLANDVVELLSEALGGEVRGFALVLNATHLCKTMRGTRNDGKMTVAHFTGVFKTDEALKNQFYELMRLQNQSDLPH